MFTYQLTLFRLFGFEVKIDASWLFLAVLVTWSLAAGLFPQQYEGFPPATYWVMGVAGALGLFISIVFHELGHSLVARRFGIPIRSITLFIFGGVADMGGEPPSAKSELWMALAGPATSIVLAAVFYASSVAASAADASPAVTAVLGYLALINVILAAFNILPAFPLDGGRVLRALLWAAKRNLRWATRISSAIGSAFGAILIGLGIVYFLYGSFIGGIWWVMIGLFVRHASSASYQQLLMRRALEGETVRRFMKTDPVAVPDYISIQELVESYIYKFHYKMFPVTQEDRLVGCVSTRDVRQVAREDWERTTVRDIMGDCALENSITPDKDAVQALSQMSTSGNSRLLVVEGGQLVGIIALKDLLAFLSLKFDLEMDRLRA